MLSLILTNESLTPSKLELQSVNTNLPARQTYASDKDEDDARTGKESLEKLLGVKLPDWIKDLLEVQNEIIKLDSIQNSLLGALAL